jgi:hypothetical protein
MDNCVLCNLNLSKPSVHFSGGLMCSDSRGCRQRALKRLEELTKRSDLLLKQANAKSSSFWQIDLPDKPGYYIGVWRQVDHTIMVSEVWYNPNAAYNWWINRGYSGDKRYTRDLLDGALKDGVIAWMPMPEPPKE